MTSRWTAHATRRPTLSTISHGQRVAAGGGPVDVDAVGAVGVESGRGLRSAGRRDGLARLACDPGTGDEGLEAAALAAGTAGAAGLDDDVADLAGEAARAAMEPSVEHDPGRDPGPDREVGEVIDVADDASAMKTERGGADVVLDDASGARSAPRAGARAASPTSRG